MQRSDGHGLRNVWGHEEAPGRSSVFFFSGDLYELSYLALETDSAVRLAEVVALSPWPEGVGKQSAGVRNSVVQVRPRKSIVIGRSMPPGRF